MKIIKQFLLKKHSSLKHLKAILQKSKIILQIKIILVLLILSISKVETTTCNSFPKFFGGTYSGTIVYHIDVFNDYLASVGYTYDYYLTGTTSLIPYIAMASIQTRGKYYWAKAFSLKTSTYLYAVQFSTDGAILIAHSGGISSNYFVVLNTSSGNLLSARYYSTGGYYNFYFQMRSMIISSGVTPNAFILSNYRTSLQNLGQHLFKFDPLTFSSTPNWIKKTLQTLYGHLGLTFGRNESLLYSFSWYDGKSIVSLLDINGNPQWQYATPDGHYDYNNLIQYKQIDSSTDMIIATSGYYYYNFNRIISSSVSPFTVQTSLSKTFRDDRSSSSRQIRALYIIDLNNAVALINEYSYTEIGSVDFQASTIKYQRTLPQLYNSMTSAIFTTSSVYYVSAYTYYFYKDQGSTSYYTGQTQSVVYTSDMTLTSCYSLAPIITPTTYNMIQVSLTSLSSPIYGPSTVTFVQDTAAMTTININLSKLYKPSFCSLYPFTVNSVAQTTTTFNIQQGVKDQYLAITPFSATVNCGTYTNTWTYSGVANSDGHTLVSTIDLIDVNSIDGKIFVSQSKLAGTYTIKVIGTLPDLVTTTYAIFTIVITPPAVNTPPVFKTILLDATVPLKTSVSYSFPVIIDPDTSDTPVISEVKESLSGLLPSFISKTTSTSLTIYPQVMSEVKAYTMIVILSDTHDTKQYSFKITVTNQPPKITTTVQSPIVLTFGQELIYNLPLSIDPEGLTYTTTITSGPPYVTIISGNTQLRIKPRDCSSDFQNQTVQIKLEDEQPSSTVYSIDLVVKNLPPVISSSTSTQNVQMNSVLQQQLPPFSDPEGCPLVYTITPVMLLQFVKIQGNQIIYSPTQIFQVGEHEVTLICTDNQGLSASTIFSLNVYQPPKFTSSIVKQIDLKASNLGNYTLPIMVGNPGEYIVHNSPLPRFASFDSPLYTFYPEKVSDLGIATITGSLFNAYTSVPFSFKVNVTNQAPYLSSPIPDQVIALNSRQSYFISDAIDREGQTVTFTAYEYGKTSLPSFVRLIVPSKEFQFAPTQLDKLKQYKIQLEVKDSFGAYSTSTFSITLYDTSSFFKSAASIQQSDSNSSSSASNINVTQTMLDMMKKQNDVQSQILGLEILKVTRDQKAQIKITNARSPISEIIALLSNSSFEISLEQKNSTQKIGFQIINKDLENYQIQINLKYPNPQNVSTQQSDKLKVIIPNRIQFLKKQIQSILPEHSYSQAEIPPQVTQKFEQSVTSFMSGGRLSLTENTPSNLAIGFMIQMVWFRLEDISFLVINSMLSISIPGIPSIIQAVMIKYMYFDILYTELWIDRFLTSIGIHYDQIKNDTALNNQFEENGFDSKQFLWNSGSSLFFLAFYILSWVILFLLSILSKISSRIYILKEKLKNQLIWKQSLNFMLSQFQPLFLSSLINMYDIRFKDNQNITVYSSFISVFVLIFISTALMLILRKVQLLTRNLNQEKINQFKEQYSILLESLKETNTQKMIYLWKPLILLRWVMTLTLIITLQDLASFQILLLLMLSVIWQCLILYARPFESRLANIISFYNEAAASIYLYAGFLLTDFLDAQVAEAQIPHLRLQISWALTGILIFTIFLNLLYALGHILISIIRKINKKCCKRKKQQVGIMYKVESFNENDQQKTGLSINESEELKEDGPDHNEELKKKIERIKIQNQYKNYNQEFYDMFYMKE